MSPASRLTFALLFAALLLAAGAALASADEATEGEDAAVVTLVPGDNIVGWVSSPHSVAGIKYRYPEIESILAWDALNQRMYEPVLLEPGMGLMFTLAGDQSVELPRPLTPAGGKTTLERGRNFVAWLGPDDWSIDRVVQGIGGAFVRAEWGQSIYRATDSADQLPTIRRGNVLWIEASRKVIWLQPTGLLPTVRYPGGASAELKAQVRADLVRVTTFFREHFAIEADTSSFLIFIPTDVEALIDAYHQDAPGRVASEELRDSLRSFYRQHGGWVASGERLVIKEFHWYEDHARSGPNRQIQSRRSLLAHEYAHVLQHQLRHYGIQASPSYTTGWLVEGTAEWVSRSLRAWENEGIWSSLRASALAAVAGSNRRQLRDDLNAERYRLGLVAAIRLAEQSGDDSIWEFWRLLGPSWFGPEERWRIDPSWQDAFAGAFGVSAEQFYDEFERWRAEQFRQISGRVFVRSTETHNASYSLRGLPVSLQGRADDGSENGVWKTFETRVSDSGEFTLSALKGKYELRVDLGGCLQEYGTEVQVTHEHVTGLEFGVDPQKCVWRISGVLLTATGEPLTDTRLHYYFEGNRRGTTSDEATGAFSFKVPNNGDYRLDIGSSGCWMYYAKDGAVSGTDDAELITIEGGDVSGLRFVLPDGWCELRISGSIVTSEGSPLVGEWVSANSDSGSSSGDRTDSLGAFSISVPSSGEYQLSASLDGCTLYYREGGMTADRDLAKPIEVGEGGVLGISLRVPKGLCEYQLRGQVLDADGIGVARAWVLAYQVSGLGMGRWSDSDGRFEITVPSSGLYRLRTRFGGCFLYYRRDGGTTSWDHATQVRVSSSDVTGIRFQPADGQCVLRISGKLLNADGTPRSDHWVSARGNAGISDVRTAGDGSFSLAVPSRGQYRMYVWIDDCRIYHGSRGPTQSRTSARHVSLTDSDITGIEFRLPEDPASFCN